MKRAPSICIAWIAVAAPIAAQGAAPPEESRTQAREIYRTIVGFETSSGKAQVPVMARYLAEQFRAAGFPEDDIHVLPLGETASLVVRYAGDGTGGRPIVLLAHMDVVAAKREDWRRDPFTLIEENGYFFGRGTSDIKGDVALITTTFLRLKADGFVPTRDLIIAFSGDEETDMMTTRSLVGEHRTLLRDAEYALNADGGGGVLDEASGTGKLYYVQGAEKLYASYTLTVRNPGGHSSEPRLDNAIYQLADALKAVQAYRFPVMWNEWTLGSLRASAAVTPGELGAAMGRFAANPQDAAAADLLYSNPSYVGMHPDDLRADAARRWACRKCAATVRRSDRQLPHLPGCQHGIGARDALWRRRIRGRGAAQRRRRAQRRLAHARGHHGRGGSCRAGQLSGREDRAAEAAYATDGSVFRGEGLPTYGVSGIFLKDSESFSHGLDERVPVDAFYKGLAHWHTLIRELAGKKSGERAQPRLSSSSIVRGQSSLSSRASERSDSSRPPVWQRGQ